MKKLLFILLASVALTGCTHHSELKHEAGVIVEKQYVPSVHVSGSSISSRGNVHYTSLSESEKYVTVFKCQHGIVFSITSAETFAKVDKNDTVDISYYEILADKDSSIVDFEFIDAHKLSY